MMQVDQLTVFFENAIAVNELSLRVGSGEIVGVIGPNSAGKSTIVQALHYAREIFARGNLNPDKTIAGGKSVNLGGLRPSCMKMICPATSVFG